MDRIPSMRSVMTPFPQSIDVGSAVREARELMVRFGVRHLPVTEKKMLVGVVTDRDIKRALDPDLGYPPKEELFVSDVAVFEPYIVDASEQLDTVLLTMAEERIGCALVVQEGKLAGIFTTTDACRLFGEYLRTEFAGTPDGGST